MGIIALHAYTPPLHAVKASQPRRFDGNVRKGMILFPIVQETYRETHVRHMKFNLSLIVIETY